MIYHDIITITLLSALDKFHQMNYHDPLVVTGINATALMTLIDLQDTSYPQLSFDVSFNYDPEPVLLVGWWIDNDADTTEHIHFRFDPLRVENDEDSKIAAYNRAMSIL